MNAPTKPSEETVRRLVFVKYMSGVAQDQAGAPEPLCALAILTLHDAIELFLQIGAERLNVGTKRTEFMQYFDLIETAQGAALFQREGVRRLNSARVAFKHHGTLPARTEIDGFCSTADEFFSSNSPALFGVSFSEISMAGLVENDEIRACVIAAESAIAAESYGDALVAAAEGFALLRRHYPLRSRSTYDAESAGRDLDKAIASPYSRGPAGQLARVVQELQEEVSLLRHGLDTRRLAVFDAITPSVVHSMAGTRHVTWTRDSSAIPAKEAKFCYDFLVESILLVQQKHSVVEGLNLDWQLRFRVNSLLNSREHR